MQHVSHRESLVLAEVEHLRQFGFAVLIEHGVTVTVFHLSPDDTASEVHVVVLLRELSQFVHIVLQHLLFVLVGTRGILVELSHQHAVGGLCILIGTVSLEVFLHLTTAVELIGSSQVASLHLPEDRTGIDHAALAEIEVDASPQKLLSEQWDIEVVRVEPGEVRALELISQRLCQLFEGRFVLHILV